MQSLLNNISALTRHLQQPISTETLTAITPKNADGDVDYKELKEVLKHQGFENNLQNRELTSIPKLALPVIILLKDSESAILKSFDNESAIIEIAGVGTKQMSLPELENIYLGYTWFIKPKVSADIRSELPEHRLSKGWFWSVILRFRKYYYQVILTTFIINILALITSLYVMNVYDRVIPNKSYETL